MIRIGPSYWTLGTLFDSLGARYVVQVPVGATNISQTLAWANSSWNIMGGTSRIDAIEIMNEPNLYPLAGPGFGYPNYLIKPNISGCVLMRLLLVFGLMIQGCQYLLEPFRSRIPVVELPG
jgi:hypothetical protein